jgi:hypothetical protein
VALKSLNTKQKADEGIDIEIFHPATGDSLGIFIHMLGSDSQAYLDAERQINRQQIEQSKRTRDFTMGMNYDQQQSSLVKKMTACFISWKEKKEDGTFKETIEVEPGVELEATPDNFQKIIKDRGFFWIRQQVQTGMDNVTNFLSA